MNTTTINNLGDVDPYQKEVGSIDKTLYSNRVHKREPFNIKPNIFPKDLISFTLPDLEEHVLMAQNTWCMTFDLDFTGTKDKGQFPIWNLESGLIDLLRIKMSGKTVLEIDDYNVLKNYLSLHLPEKDQEEKIFEGMQSDADLKVRVGSEGITPAPGQLAIKKVYGKRFKLSFDMFPLFTKIGPIYPYALRDKEIVVEIRFAPASKIVRGSTATKISANDKDYNYKLSNVLIEWSEFKHPYFASQMASKYNSLRLRYKKITRIPLKKMEKEDKLVNIRLNAPGESISGFLILMVDDGKRADFNHQVKEYYNPQFSKITTTYKGSSHRLFENGMYMRDSYDSLLKLAPNTNVKEAEFYTNHFGIWLDTRLSSKNELHGGGYNFRVGDEVNIAIHRAGEVGGNVDIYTYIFQDSTLLNVGGRFVEESDI